MTVSRGLTLTAEYHEGDGPVENFVFFLGTRSDELDEFSTFRARIGLPKRHKVNNAAQKQLTTCDGEVVVDVPTGAIPAGANWLQTMAEGTLPFDMQGEGLPASTRHFVQAFSLALIDVSDEVMTGTAFSPPLSVTVTYSETQVESARLEEGDLTMMRYDGDSGQWQAVAGAVKDEEANTFQFSLAGLEGETQFGIVDGQPLPPAFGPAPESDYKVYLPIVLR